MFLFMYLIIPTIFKTAQYKIQDFIFHSIYVWIEFDLPTISIYMNWTTDVNNDVLDHSYEILVYFNCFLLCLWFVVML
jgi:hypothetical protein